MINIQVIDISFHIQKDRMVKGKLRKFRTPIVSLSVIVFADIDCSPGDGFRGDNGVLFTCIESPTGSSPAKLRNTYASLEAFQLPKSLTLIYRKVQNNPYLSTRGIIP